MEDEWENLDEPITGRAIYCASYGFIYLLFLYLFDENSKSFFFV